MDGRSGMDGMMEWKHITCNERKGDKRTEERTIVLCVCGDKHNTRHVSTSGMVWNVMPW